jgi:hypothetical protein
MVTTALVALMAIGGLSACTPEEMQLYADLTAEHDDALTPNQLQRLRECESGDDYGAIGGGGAYRGAYQFTRSTWNAVARRNYPFLRGQDPARADTWWQDAQAEALWDEQGRHPWPYCGRRVGHG